MRLIGTVAAVAAALFSAQAFAQNFQPSIVFDMGGKFDKSFNEAAWNGAERFTKEFGIKYREFEVTNESQREQAVRQMAQRGGNPVVATGFSNASAIEKTAAQYPKRNFAIIDNASKGDNIRSVLFKEHEGSFLVGMLAALKTKSDVLGFVGGMDIPLIRKFACGYAQGAKYVNPKVKVLINMTGNDASAWNNPGRGNELATSQFERGADVVYAAAGSTGNGVYQAAADAHKYAIGVDSNQNHLHPGTMLTSMVKKVDEAVYKVFKDVMKGEFKGGEILHLGLKENGVDWAYDKYNRNLITDEMKKRVDKAEKDIVEGKIKVHDYTSDNKCVYY